ncbi:hypothetical protein K466DRAFT_494520, partial [Polyporus arcularius HHB13444]
PKEHVAPFKHLYLTILAHWAPVNSVTAYALAASHYFHSLTVPISSYLLLTGVF